MEAVYREERTWQYTMSSPADEQGRQIQEANIRLRAHNKNISNPTAGA